MMKIKNSVQNRITMKIIFWNVHGLGDPYVRNNNDFNKRFINV